MYASLRAVTLEWPDGQRLFGPLDLTLERKKYGLVGPNGVGKSTLARLLVGDLEPSSGVVTGEPMIYSSQFEERPLVTVESLLDPAVWSEASARSLLEGLALDRSCADLSGGEWMRVRLARALGRGRNGLILDEPTNDLDREGREVVRDLVRRFEGCLLLISHDRDLLRHVDVILELSNRGVATYGGGWEFYDRERSRERTGGERRLDLAKRERDTAEKSRVEKMAANDKRNRHGEARGPSLGLSRLALGAMKRRAQVGRGRLDVATRTDLEKAVTDARVAFDEIKIDPVMYVEGLKPRLHGHELIASATEFNHRFEGAERPLWRMPLTFHLRGPRRVAIKGPNGSGKSTLLRLLVADGGFENLTGPKVPFAFLEQDSAHLDSSLTVLETLHEVSSSNDEVLRNELAKFQFRREKVFQTVASLSGGEKLRLSLARALLQDPSPSLLILDEPTNNVDVANVEFLERLLAEFTGAILIVSHDDVFLDRAGIDEVLELD